MWPLTLVDDRPPVILYIYKVSANVSIYVTHRQADYNAVKDP